jgi:hypothetical protein
VVRAAFIQLCVWRELLFELMWHLKRRYICIYVLDELYMKHEEGAFVPAENPPLVPAVAPTGTKCKKYLVTATPPTGTKCADR